MLRLTFVFSVWLASTAYALGDDPDMTAARSQEADDDEKILLDRAQERVAGLRRLRLTETNERTIFVADECADGEGRAHAHRDTR